MKNLHKLEVTYKNKKSYSVSLEVYIIHLELLLLPQFVKLVGTSDKIRRCFLLIKSFVKLVGTRSSA